MGAFPEQCQGDILQDRYIGIVGKIELLKLNAACQAWRQG
ncbi:MAG: hypothetical protein CM15mP120_26270 [Pseudomonadota bacterium]|nr:MAG: hypothetical protein CM15mP120_26270 [Pseudomonadota bacterium]